MIPVDKVKRIRGALGLAMSAGAVSVGVGLVIDAVRRAGKSDRRKKGSASRHVYVFCASDASEATKKRVFDKCAYYEIPVYELPITRGSSHTTLAKLALLLPSPYQMKVLQ